MTKIRQKKFRKQKEGFTLLELLIAMVILALLVGLGMQSFGGVQKRSRDSRRKQDLANIAKALEVYYNDFGQYPLTGEGHTILACGTNTVPAACNWEEAWQATVNGETVLYMVELPNDPVDGATYYYNSDGSTYTLYAKLENDEDIDIAMDGDVATVYEYAICSEGASDPDCNFYLTSSNNINLPEIIQVAE